MRIRSVALVALALLAATVCACSGDRDNIVSPIPPSPVAISAIQALPNAPLGALVQHDAAAPNLIRIRYTSSDSSDAGSTPWQPSDSSIIVLGLKPEWTYGFRVQSLFEGRAIDGPITEYTAPPLPAALSQVTVHLEGSLSGGYSMANIDGSDGHGYLIIFDSVGTIRWYRDFGPGTVFAATQQENGNITAYSGFSSGFDGRPGHYVEITPAGDSVRGLTATGSPYTDPHELIERFDADGVRTADYLFGYSVHYFHETPWGGPGNMVVHQVLKLGALGEVDTLIAGDEHWTPADDIEPPNNIPDLDHPNSIDFDLDGGVIVSYRSLNAVVKVDPGTHHIEWQLGGTDNQFTFVGDPLGGFDGQHTVRVLPNGHLLMFDNGWLHSPPASRAVEYELDTVHKTATMVWQYSASPPIFNDFTGSAQRLANGHTVIAWTRSGIFYEVAADGSVVSSARLETAPGQIAMPYRVTRIKNLYYYARP